MSKRRTANGYSAGTVHIVNRELKHSKNKPTKVRKEQIDIHLRQPTPKPQDRHHTTPRPCTKGRRITLRSVGPPAMVYPDGTSAVRYVTPRSPKKAVASKRVKFVPPQTHHRQRAQKLCHTRITPKENVDEDLIAGLCRQGIRCREISKALEQLRPYVSTSQDVLLRVTVKQVKNLRAALFQLVDYFDLYPKRLRLVLFYINAVYGTTSYTIQKIMSILRDSSISSSRLWSHLLSGMGKELGGLELYEALRIYRDFVLSLSHLLKGDHPFDARPVEELYDYTLQLRLYQGLGGKFHFSLCFQYAY